MRLDHLLSKEEEVRVLRTVQVLRRRKQFGEDEPKGEVRNYSKAVSKLSKWEARV